MAPRRRFDALCRAAFDSTISAMFEAEEHAPQRRPGGERCPRSFHFDVDLNCEDRPDAGAEQRSRAVQGQRNKTVDVRGSCTRADEQNRPLVSCIMPTHNRRRFVPQAVQYFLRQDYPHRELIIVDDGTDTIRDLVPDTPSAAADTNHHIGAKRNLACREARGIIALGRRRLDGRLAHYLSGGQPAQDPGGYLRSGAAAHMNQPRGKPGNTSIQEEASRGWPVALVLPKAFWQRHAFPNMSVGEDARFVWRTGQENTRSAG